MSNDQGVRPAYQGELMLAGWTDNHTAGAKVSFWLPDQQALESFRYLTVKKGRTAGQRFMAVLIQIGDDEQPIQPGEDQASAKPSRALCLSAVQMCRNSDFQQFIGQAQGYLPDDAKAREELAAQYIKDFCRIGSRRDLDTSPTAAQLFMRLMQQYRDWCRATGVQS